MEGRMFRAGNAATLPTVDTETALDGIAAGLPDSGLIQPFRDLIVQAR